MGKKRDDQLANWTVGECPNSDLNTTESPEELDQQLPSTYEPKQLGLEGLYGALAFPKRPKAGTGSLDGVVSLAACPDKMGSND